MSRRLSPIIWGNILSGNSLLIGIRCNYERNRRIPREHVSRSPHVLWMISGDSRSAIFDFDLAMPKSFKMRPPYDRYNLIRQVNLHHSFILYILLLASALLYYFFHRLFNIEVMVKLDKSAKIEKQWELTLMFHSYRNLLSMFHQIKHKIVIKASL